MTSIHAKIQIPIDLNTLPEGSLSFWILPLEELTHRFPVADRRKGHPGTDHQNHILLGDHPDLENVKDSRFAIVWDSGWYPQLWVKFFPNHLYHHGFRPERKLLLIAGHFSFCRLRWHQIAITWNKPLGRAALYVNGVLITTSPTDAPLTADSCAPTLFAGSTAYAMGDFCFYSQELSRVEIENHYRSQETSWDENHQSHLRHVYLGERIPSFQTQLDSSWKETLSLPLNRESELKEFYIQGRTQAPRITPEGLRVETGDEYPEPHPAHDDQQVYLWSEKSFEGDLYLTCEFMSLQRGGLSLLMTQASGLHGEDFMSDYPRRTTGSMSMVCWENVRNYHWEYYREMVDTRHDRGTHALIKNPWTRPLAYQSLPSLVTLNEWHRLEFLQEGSHIRGILDGQLMFDVQDDGNAGHGPVYRHGRFAIRCMHHTKMIFRNLKVYNRAPLYARIDGTTWEGGIYAV